MTSWLLALALAAAGEAPPDGAAVFKAKCAVCHDERAWASQVMGRGKPAGAGVLAARKGRPAAYTKQIIRKGIGAMPGFTPVDVSDAQAVEVAAWLER